MADPRLLDYVRRNIHLGYTEEQLRKVLISAGYNVRDIDDALDTIIRPQYLTSQAPPKKEGPPEEPSFFQRMPTWMLVSSGAGIFLLVVIIILLIPSGSGPPGLLFQNGIKVPAYELSCMDPATTFTLTVKNEADTALADVQLFIDEVFQQDQILKTLEKGASATYTYEGVECKDWIGEKSIKIVSNKATAEGTILFECTSGTCV